MTAAKRKPSRAPRHRPAKPAGPKTLEGSRQAKRVAAALLEALSGTRTPQDASTVLGISLSRYYVLETRALQGFIAALEPRPRGRQRSAADVIASLERDRARLEREVARSQALVRAAQRSLGLSAAKPAKRDKLTGTGKTGKKKTRRPRRIVRAARAIAALTAPETTTDVSPESSTGEATS